MATPIAKRSRTICHTSPAQKVRTEKRARARRSMMYIA